MIVIDASAAIELLLGTPRGHRVMARVLHPDERLHAPHLIDLEVAQVFRRYVASGDVSAHRGDQALEDWLGLPVDRYPHDVLLPRIWELRHNATAYDASYLALAEALDATLVTCDRHLASVPGQSATVEVI
jgi:predicted nucleic acid-binding protein